MLKFPVLQILTDILKAPSLGRKGLMYLVFWSVYRQLSFYTDPLNYGEEEIDVLRGCYRRVYAVLSIPLINPYLKEMVQPDMGKTRQVALRKLDKLKFLVGDALSKPDLDRLEEYYGRLPDVPKDRLFPSWIKALRLAAHMKWLDQHTIRFDPAVVNAFYTNDHNIAIIPTAILTRPFFFSPGTRPINYGAVGAVIGHEIMHGYDVIGITIDDEKKKRNWVSPNFLKVYTDKAYCLWKSYEDVMERHKRHVKLNDKLDSENLADFVGVATSYAALKSLPEHQGSVTMSGLNMTADHLFFISYCMQWCANLDIPVTRYAPQGLRCIGPLMNMREFSAAFGCEPGTLMNPLHKCDFW
ncbi:hypothetical protein MTO96_027564 [Rhipicephalus appendiculatus]